MNGRVRELDSLRGVAIILVMGFHVFRRANTFTHHPTLYFITNLTSVGWVGVDIFFVLSGFLITSILLQTKAEKNYFKNFYVRRALRIFPLYFVYLTIILVFIPILDPEFTSQRSVALPYLLLYQQNWISFLGHIVLTPYLAVTWSLAIEEQFYLIWPAIVYFTQKQTLIKICIGVIMTSIIARTLGILFWLDTNQATKFFYYGSFSRFEQLVFGALLAISLTYPNWHARIRFAALPVFLLALSAFLTLCIVSFPHIIPYYVNIPLTLGVYTLAAVFSTALIAMLLTHPETFILRRLFKNKILSFFGKYSYSMYLVHVPIALLLLEPLWQTRIRGWKMYLTFIVLTFAMTAITSLLTWHVLEKHMLSLKKYFEHKSQFKRQEEIEEAVIAK